MFANLFANFSEESIREQENSTVMQATLSVILDQKDEENRKLPCQANAQEVLAASAYLFCPG